MIEKNINKILTGVVASIDDPTRAGRIKVITEGYNENTPIEQLPWVTFAGSAMSSGDGGGSISIPRVGSKVRLNYKKANDPNSMEWTAINRIDRKLSEELAGDYEGSHTVLYDSESDLSIMYKNETGLRLYFKGSFIQISPENNITLHYGEGNQGVQIQLSDGKVDIQANANVNITSGSQVNVNAENINLMGSQNVRIKGDHPGDCAVNGKELFMVLMNMARLIDQKIPATAGACSNVVQSAKSSILNQQIQYM